MPLSSNYFEFFELPLALSVDAAGLRQKYLENSRKFHPDFHTLASAEEQAQALELSTLNNEAYKTLSDPDKRLQYVLKIKGLLEEGSANEKLPQNFLLEVMEVNEKIMELEFDPNPDTYIDSIKLVNDLESNINKDFTAIIQDWDERTGTAESLLAAKDYFLKKRYLLRVKENLSKFASAFE